MEWVNYHHLLYFWMVAREGSLAGASAELRLAPSTVSKQIHLFEQMLGQALFAKVGRRLVLNENGKVVFRYADEIFGLGREMLDTLRDRPIGRPLRLTVGIADVVPKLIAERVLAPALRLATPVRVICKDGKPDRLLADLVLHEFDVILTDAPASQDANVRVFSHLLGESDITLFGQGRLASKYRRNFPRSLNGAPMLLPTENTVLRRSIEQWFEATGLRPNVVGEFEDSALLNVFGLRGVGLFPAASVIAKDIEAQHGVRAVGRLPDVRERVYAVSLDRRVKHPAVVAICDAAKNHGS
jgi:LysR family transcriptional activator of nhaA